MEIQTIEIFKYIYKVLFISVPFLIAIIRRKYQDFEMFSMVESIKSV